MQTSKMDKKLHMVVLLDFYGALLNDNQQELMRQHYEEDWTLAEIAQSTGVSRQSVHDTLTRAGQQLMRFEEKLGLVKRFEVTQAALDVCAEALGSIEATGATQHYLLSAKRALEALKGGEE